MKPKAIPALLSTVAASLVVAVLPSQAQQIYSENFDTDVNPSMNWVTNALQNSPADLYFDYSTIGIPPAPNSTGGTTRGVKLNANLGPTGAFPGGVSVSPMNFSLPVSGNWVIHCDWWINFNGPAPGGGSGSTQEGGLGFGTQGSSAQVVGISDSMFFVTTGDGGTSSDYRAYSGAFPGSLQLSSGAYLAGSRDSAASYYATNFPGATCPAAQVALYPQQTGTVQNGAMGWKWHDFKIEKLGPYVTWYIDNVPLMIVDATTNGILGDKLLLTHSDINTGASTDTNAAALAFSLFDNLRVSNIVADVVSISAVAPNASEAGPNPGTFTLSRTLTGSPLTVSYKVSGTASNGVDYTNILGGPLSGTIMFAAGDSSTNIMFMPIDDTISEPLETVILTILPGPGYVAAGSATATIADNDTPLLIASAGAGSMYERHTNDYASVKITRWGDTSVPLTLNAGNFTYAGTAVLNTDFIVNTGVFPFSIDSGVVETNINLVSPLDNSVYTGNKTILVGLASGTGFSVALSNASLTIIDDENPPATVLYTNALTSAADAANWGLTYANGDLATFGGTDYEASFGYDLTANMSLGGVISPPPGGANNALRTTVNKVNASNAGINLYPTNQSFSGDYAVRFNMNVVLDTAGGTTQGPIFGINHDGRETNWWAGSGVVSGGPWASDGIWYWISADGGAAAGDYILQTGLGGALPNTGWTRPIAAGLIGNFVNYFKGPPVPYSGSSGPGLVGNDPPALPTGDTRTWTDVEIKQIGRTVTLYLNKIQVLTYSNSTSFTSGKIMLGYSDPFNSIGEAAGAVYYANLSVVRLTPPLITKITRSGSNVTINFNSPDGTDTTTTLKLQSSTTAIGPFADDPAATVTQLPNGTYQATTTSSATTQFYRIRKG